MRRRLVDFIRARLGGDLLDWLRRLLRPKRTPSYDGRCDHCGRPLPAAPIEFHRHFFDTKECVSAWADDVESTSW